MRFFRCLLVFSYGLFAIAAQTLLFREFLTTFEGNDIGVGIFFGSWFLWVGAGAILVNKSRILSDRLHDHIELLLLGYIPAFVLQWILILQAREIAGIESYALFPITLMVLLSAVVNAPVSVITGMFFPTACRWLQREEALAVSKVYIIEAAGSFCGGLGVTLLLGFGINQVTVFLGISLVISSAAFCLLLTGSARIKAAFVCIIVGSILFCMFGETNRFLSQYQRRMKWSKLLPQETLAGSFQTAQAEYLYGMYQGQWLVMRQGSVCESLGDAETTGRTAAISLCQNPEAGKILVIGSGPGLCESFLKLDQVKQVTWAHCDTEYASNLEKYAPVEFKVNDKRLERLDQDIRVLLDQRRAYYDIVIINLPDPTSSVFNRFYTLEFYQQIKETLARNGILSVRISGGENIMGTELVSLGASAKFTLQRVFPQLVIAPGEETWFIASNWEILSSAPGVLYDRFASIEGSDDIFPPQGLLSVYLPDRAQKALDAYTSTNLPKGLLINRDARPLASLYNLLLAAKQSGSKITRQIKHLALSGIWPFVIPLLVFIVLRVIYIFKTPRSGEPSGFDSLFLVFSGGLGGIGVMIILMYLYQTRFGSLYLHVGVISSLFMAGLTIGSVLIRYMLINRKIRLDVLLLLTLVFHIAVIVVAAERSLQNWTHLAFAVIFILLGFCTGSYFPLAASQLAGYGIEAPLAGSKLEMADHIGAATGAFFTGLGILQVTGTRMALLIFSALMLINVILAVIRLCNRQAAKISVPGFQRRRLGYVLFGAGVCIILWSNLLAHAAALLAPSLPEQTVHALGGGLNFEKVSAMNDQKGDQIDYFILSDSDEKVAGYIFSTADLVPQVRGFGGKFNLAVRVNTLGILDDFHIVRSNETPGYLKLLTEWQNFLKGYNLFEAKSLVDVHTVTGATVSSRAVLSALQGSGQKFAQQVLNDQRGVVTAQRHWKTFLPDVHGIYLISFFALALIVTFFGGFWPRIIMLVLSFVIGGIILNTQYSTEQIMSLLSNSYPSISLSGVFLLMFGVPIYVVVFGNYYCGYICPVGIAQELAGFVIPRRSRPILSKDVMNKACFIKYILLFVIITIFFISQNHGALTADPLIEIFSGSMPRLVLIITGIALLGSLFYVRFWCRYFCPVGAFLSLLNSVALLKRYLPAKSFGQCEFGVTVKGQLDCICCDRCRYESKPRAEGQALSLSFSNLRLMNRYFLVPVVLIAVFVTTASLDGVLKTVDAERLLSSSMSSGGQVRDVDLDKIRIMIRQNKLSSKEADFYKEAE